MTQSLLLIAVLGIGSSAVTEIVSWFNARINQTGLTSIKGKGAYILAIGVSLLIATIKVALFSGSGWSWNALGTEFASIWTVSQLVFVYIVEWLGLTVSSVDPVSVPSQMSSTPPPVM